MLDGQNNPAMSFRRSNECPSKRTDSSGRLPPSLLFFTIFENFLNDGPSPSIERRAGKRSEFAGARQVILTPLPSGGNHAEISE